MHLLCLPPPLFNRLMNLLWLTEPGREGDERGRDSPSRPGRAVSSPTRRGNKGQSIQRDLIPNLVSRWLLEILGNSGK